MVYWKAKSWKNPPFALGMHMGISEDKLMGYHSSETSLPGDGDFYHNDIFNCKYLLEYPDKFSDKSTLQMEAHKQPERIQGIWI